MEGFDPRVRDIKGQTTGFLTALYPTTGRASGNVVWVWRCVCGKEILGSADKLKRKDRKRQSCGCMQLGVRSARYKGVGDLSGQKWANMKNGAARRGHEFTISIQEAWDLFLRQNKTCVLTGLPITLNPTTLAAGANTASLDRIDSRLGYVPGNIQWVHAVINSMKQTLSNEHFVIWCQNVAYHAYAHGATFGKGTAENPHHY